MNQPLATTIKVEPEALIEIMNVATRRVSAFLRLALDDLSARGVADFNLTANISYRFWPDAITEAQRVEAREEFRVWIMGASLRELDLMYGLFLDRLWASVELIGLHGKVVPSGHLLDQKFAADTNVARKHQRVAVLLGTRERNFELNSLSLARNALAHNLGVVRQRDCNNPERTILSITWSAFDMIASRGGQTVTIGAMPFDTSELPGDGEVQLGMQFNPRCVEIAAGSRITFSHAHLAELCSFYRGLCAELIEGLKAYCASKGLV